MRLLSAGNSPYQQQIQIMRMNGCFMIMPVQEALTLLICLLLVEPTLMVMVCQMMTRIMFTILIKPGQTLMEMVLATDRKY